MHIYSCYDDTHVTLRHFYIKWTLLKIVTKITDHISPILKIMSTNNYLK